MLVQNAPCLSNAPLVETEELPLLPRRRRPWIRTWFDTGFRAMILCVVAQGCVAQGYRVFGHCMEPNLFTGERLLGSKVALWQGLRRGDVVIFQPPHKPDSAFIKRVVGLPGEVLEIRDNRVYVNGKLLDEPYLQRAWHDNRAPERIAPNTVYVMGDNRDESNDSRAWGELPMSHIQAKAWMRYWPLERVGLIR